MTTATYDVTEIRISQIFPPHGVRDSAKLAALTASMEQGGWAGRPLLVIEHGDGYRALTGSHRYAAAQAAGLEEVPCVEVDAEKFFANYDTSDLWDDDVNVSILDEIGDTPAAQLMREEVVSNNETE